MSDQNVIPLRRHVATPRESDLEAIIDRYVVLFAHTADLFKEMAEHSDMLAKRMREAELHCRRAAGEKMGG